MRKLFEIVFLQEAYDFLKSLDKKHYEKILYNIRKAQIENDPELFKKINDDIWNSGLYIREFIIGFYRFGIKLINQSLL